MYKQIGFYYWQIELNFVGDSRKQNRCLRIMSPPISHSSIVALHGTSWDFMGLRAVDDPGFVLRQRLQALAMGG